MRRGEAFGAELAAALVRDNFSGANIDFEPATDADDERSALNPTIADAVDYSAFLDTVAKALHKVGKTLSADILSVVESCGEHGGPPCPWVRRLWNMDVLATTNVDRFFDMNGYSQNLKSIQEVACESGLLTGRDSRCGPA